MLNYIPTVKEEFAVNQILSVQQKMDSIFQQTFLPFVATFVEGANVCIFGFGATGTGKSYTLEGSQTESGLISLFMESLYTTLAHKANQVRRE